MQTSLEIIGDINLSNIVEPKDLGEMIVGILKQHQSGMTRDELVSVLSIPRTTIYDAMRRYIKNDTIKKKDKEPEKRQPGRRQVLFHV